VVLQRKGDKDKKEKKEQISQKPRERRLRLNKNQRLESVRP
jgi:hypothetical protein